MTNAYALMSRRWCSSECAECNAILIAQHVAVDNMFKSVGKMAEKRSS